MLARVRTALVVPLQPHKIAAKLVQRLALTMRVGWGEGGSRRAHAGCLRCSSHSKKCRSQQGKVGNSKKGRHGNEPPREIWRWRFGETFLGLLQVGRCRGSLGCGMRQLRKGARDRN